MSQEAIENIYTIPFYPRLNKTAPYRRTPRAIRLLKEFIIKHTKADFVVIDEELNEFMWRKGIRNPPRKIKEKIATVELIHEKVEVAARPELEGITIPGELEEEEEEEEEQEEEQEEDKTGVEKQPEPTKDSSKEEEQAE